MVATQPVSPWNSITDSLHRDSIVRSQATRATWFPWGRRAGCAHLFATCIAILTTLQGFTAQGDEATGPSLRALANHGIPVIEPSLFGVTSDVLIPITSRHYTPGLVDLLADVRVPFSLKLNPDVSPTRADLERIAALPHLAGVELPATQMDLRNVFVLAGAPSITSLYVSDVDLRGMDCAALRSLLSVRYLCLDRSVLDDPEWHCISAAVNLEHLSCDDMALPPAAWLAMRSLPRLRALTIGGPNLSQKDIQNLLRIDGLSALTINQAALTVDHMDALSQFTNCRSLTLEFTTIENSSLRPLARLSHLRELNVTATEMSARDISSLSQLKDLATLDLSDSGLDDDGLEDVAELHGLRSLRIERCPAISDTGFMALGALSALENLEVSGGHISSQGFATVLAMPKLQSLRAYGVDVTDDVLSKLPELRELRRLALYMPHPANAAADVARKMLSIGRLASLEELEVSGIKQNAETLSTISHLAMLKKLVVRDSGLLSHDLVGLEGLANLESLDISGNVLIDDGVIEALSHLPKLKTLRVETDKISEAGLRALGEKYLIRLPDETVIPGVFHYLFEAPSTESLD
jgi:Leucine-rich repeat (LRR) protein